MLARIRAVLADAFRRGVLAPATAALWMLFALSAQAATPGSTIVNLARLSASGVLLAQASVSVRVSADVAFLRHAPTGSDLSVSLAPVGCQGIFLDTPSFLGTAATGSLPALPATYPLAASNLFRVGEPIFFMVEDAARNGDALQRDTLDLVIRNARNGDSVTLTLPETGPDTGIFAGFVNTMPAAAVATDCLLSVAAGDSISARYADEVDVEAELVDPYGLVFDSATGARIDNARITLIDETTGLPAVVVGDAGEPYPNPVFTGSQFSTSALNYQLRPGEYRFPFVEPGRDYRLVVEQLPPGYVFPTARPDDAFLTVPDGPYVVGTGSRGDPFPVPQGPPVRVDLPVDAAGSGLFVVKTAARTQVAIGDFVPFDVTVTNVLASPFTGVVLRDVLPPGFRYRRGTLRIDGAAAPEPQLSADGRHLEVPLGLLAGNGVVRVNYVTEVTAAARTGQAVNTAQAQSGAVLSNLARATVRVREDLMRGRALLAGRVLEVDDCSAEAKIRARPVAEARLYLENGRYVLSDARGRWHFDNLRPGTHVLQLDSHGLPEGSELLDCVRNTRSAGNVRSRFVDLQGGTLWQEDFYIKRREALFFRMQEVAQEVRTRFSARHEAGLLHFRFVIENPATPLDAAALELKLPPALTLLPESLRLGDAPLADFRLPALPPGRHELQWQARLDTVRDAVHAVETTLAVEAAGQRLVLPVQRHEVSVATPEQVGRVIVFRPRFASFSTE
ncbi:MAG: hypothetical protein ACK4UT_00735, partial [Moraxellaceae bacterium]